MTNQTEIKFNLKGLEEITNAIGGSARARVGILGGDVERKTGEITNSELMMIQMFGSLINKIPARDPLYEPIIKHKRKLIKSLSSGAMRAAFERKDFIGMLRLLGIEAEIIVQEAFETSGDGTWQSNADITINGGWMKNKKSGKSFYVKGKQSDRPLINTSALRRAVTSDVVKSGNLPSATVAGGPNI